MCLHLFTLLSSALRCSRAVFGSGDVLHTSFVFLALNPCFCWEWQLSRVHMSEPVTWSQRLWLVLLLTDIIKHYMTPSKIQVLFEVTAVERAVFAHRVMTGLIFWSYSQRWDVIFFSTHCFHKAARDSVEAASCFPHSSGLMFSASLVSSSVTLKGFFGFASQMVFVTAGLPPWPGRVRSSDDVQSHKGMSVSFTARWKVRVWTEGIVSECQTGEWNYWWELCEFVCSFTDGKVGHSVSSALWSGLKHLSTDWTRDLVQISVLPLSFLAAADVLVFYPDIWRIIGCFATNFQSASAVFSVPIS